MFTLEMEMEDKRLDSPHRVSTRASWQRASSYGVVFSYGWPGVSNVGSAYLAPQSADRALVVVLVYVICFKREIAQGRNVPVIVHTLSVTMTSRLFGHSLSLLHPSRKSFGNQSFLVCFFRIGNRAPFRQHFGLGRAPLLVVQQGRDRPV
jgi:hypothetical protein